MNDEQPDEVAEAADASPVDEPATAVAEPEPEVVRPEPEPAGVTLRRSPAPPVAEEVVPIAGLPEPATASRNFGPHGGTDEDVEVAVEFRDGLGEAVAPVIAGSITSVKVDGDEVTYEAKDVADIPGIAALTVHASGVSGPRTVIVHVRD